MAVDNLRIKSVETIIKNNFSKKYQSLVCNSVKAYVPTDKWRHVYSIFFYWLARHKAKFYLKNHCLLVFQKLFSEDYSQRMSKLMLHSSISCIQGKRVRVGRHRGKRMPQIPFCGSEVKRHMPCLPPKFCSVKRPISLNTFTHNLIYFVRPTILLLQTVNGQSLNIQDLDLFEPYLLNKISRYTVRNKKTKMNFRMFRNHNWNLRVVCTVYNF